MAFNTLLLVIPPQVLVMDGFRTGLVALAAYAKRKVSGLTVKLLDLSSTAPSRLKTTLEKSLRDCRGPVMAGVSTVTADYQAALNVIKTLKSLDDDIVTTMGGHHASGDFEVILQRHPEVDYVICGEGETALHELLESYPAIENVPNLAFRRNSRDRVKPNPPAPYLSPNDLDLVPIDYEGAAFAKTPGKFDHVTYVSARGCPLECSFCAVANAKIRAKSVPQVKNDIRELVEKGFSRIAFEDNFFAHTAPRTRGICEALIPLRTSGLKFSWDCQTRVESIAQRPELIPLLEQAGCDAVYLGIESLDEESLVFLGKVGGRRNPQSYISQTIERAVPALLDSGIQCFINLQFGLPNETQEQINSTLRRVEQLGRLAVRHNRQITIFPQLFVVYPGTLHFLQFTRAGLFPRDIFEDFTEWEAVQPPVLEWLGATFAHGTGGIPLGILDGERLRNGAFSVDGMKTLQITQTIERLDQLPGVKVFHYGQYLVKGDIQ